MNSLRFGLRHAIINNNIDSIIHFVDDNDINDPIFKYICQYAIQYGKIEIIQILYDNGYNIHISDESALRSAVSYNKIDIVRYLLNNGANPDANEYESLKMSVEIKSIDLLRELHRHNGNIHFDDENLLRRAVILECTDIIEYLIDNDANIHCRNDNPIRISCMYGNLHYTQYFIEHGADPRALHDLAMNWAFRYGYKEIVQYLIDLNHEIPLPSKNTLFYKLSPLDWNVRLNGRFSGDMWILYRQLRLNPLQKLPIEIWREILDFCTDFHVDTKS